jgi:hypothetical protein
MLIESNLCLLTMLFVIPLTIFDLFLMGTYQVETNLSVKTMETSI